MPWGQGHARSRMTEVVFVALFSHYNVNFLATLSLRIGIRNDVINAKFSHFSVNSAADLQLTRSAAFDKRVAISEEETADAQ